MIVKSNIPHTTIPRDVRNLENLTGNLYESLVVVAKRANQISSQIKEELHNKLSEFASDNDTLEEVFENREQIEISTHYEKMPKPTIIAIEEFLDGKVYHRNPTKEQ